MPTGETSIRDVAERAGVSIGTVSNVLNRPELVAEVTRSRVEFAIDQLGFVRNDAARQLKMGFSDSLGFLMLDVRNPFFTDVARGAEQQAARHRLSVLLANSDDTPDRESNYLELFERQRVRGVLVSPIADVFGRLDRLRRRGISSVLVDRVADGQPYSSVSVDDVRGGYLATMHLIEQGCRQIAYVGGPVGVRQVADRLTGATQAADEHADVRLEVLLRDALDVPSGRTAGRALGGRSARRRPDGVFCANDLLAAGVLQALTADHDLRVPEDVALVGYDDIDLASLTLVPLTSVRQPSMLLGRTAVDLVVEDLAAGPDAEHRNVVFTPELVTRESTRRR